MTADELFWNLVEPLYADPAVSRSTMMGAPCVRYDGKFFASLDGRTHALIVKLPRERVTRIIEDGRGEPFAPAGRVFREWVAVPHPDRRRWRALLLEARSFAAGRSDTGRAQMSDTGFAGFGAAGFAFLAALGEHNTKAFFDANRTTYHRELFEPAKAFVVALGHRLTQQVSPRLRAEPRVGASLFRINNDLRFSKGTPPYKTHLDFLFWEGDGPPRTNPAVIVRVDASEVLLGAGVADLSGAALDEYRTALRTPALAAALDDAVDALIDSGATITEPTRSRVPDSLDRTGPVARFAVRDGFHVTRRFPRPADSITPGFAAWCADRLVPFADVHRWLVRAVGNRRGSVNRSP